MTSRVHVAIAWILVGLPLLWGVFNTIKKAMALFR
jgi:thiosulfate reductase cytochrome b subunit